MILTDDDIRDTIASRQIEIMPYFMGDRHGRCCCRIIGDLQVIAGIKKGMTQESWQGRPARSRQTHAVAPLPEAGILFLFKDGQGGDGG